MHAIYRVTRFKIILLRNNKVLAFSILWTIPVHYNKLTFDYGIQNSAKDDITKVGMASG